MKNVLSGLLMILLCGHVFPQDLVIINTHIIDATGTNIPNGSVVIRNGRITSISSAMPADTPDLTVLDAGGMALLPGYIDAHRHIMRGDSDVWLREEAAERMQEFLDAGYTTLMSGGGPVPGILQLKQLIESGEIRGPRIITSGRVDPGNFPTPDAARAEVGKMAAAGVSIIKARMDSVNQQDILSVIVDEAAEYGLEVMVHASSSPAVMMAAAESGAGKLVHTPHGGAVTDDQARAIAAAGIENLTTAGFAVPTFGAFNDDNIPTFRDGNAWPEGILEGGTMAAGEKVVNARTLWDNGVTLGFGTDTGYLPREGLKHELRTLYLMFSEQDLIRLMGPNTSAFIDMEDELGTIEAGKIADLVLVEGDPLDIIFDLLNVKVVIQSGTVVVDHRN